MNAPLPAFSLDIGSISGIAGLHRLVLPTATAKIPGLLEALYGGLLADALSRAWGFGDKAHPLGFLSITEDLFRTQAGLRRRLSTSLKLRSAIALLTRPAAVGEKIGHWAFERAVRRRVRGPYPFILTLGLDPVRQGQGAGAVLIKTADDHFFGARGLGCYYVDTEERNQRAVRFYGKAGFERIFSESGHVLLRRNRD